MLKKLKILHLEDEPSDALLISLSLKKRQLENECVVADSKEKFLQALNNFDPDIILADHSLPSFNSFEALELLEKLEKPIPVILVTATMTDEFAVDIIKKGAKDYVLKDRLERLPSAIQNVLKTHHLEIERQDFLLQLERNERKFRRLIENSAGAVTILSPDGVPTYVSNSVKNVLGYSDEEIHQLNILEIIHLDHHDCFSKKLEKCIEYPERPFHDDVVRVRHKSGDWRWLETTVINLIDDPDIGGIVVDFRDVTERKLAEKALSESEERYRTFFENSQDGILLTVTDGRILAANAAACKMFQRTEREICEAGRFGLVDPKDPRVLQAIKERQSKGKVLCEINMVRKDGSIFPAALSSSVFKNAHGEPRTSMIIRDNTEANRAEENLRASEEKYKQLFQMSPLPNLIYDVDTFEILDVNNGAIEHYGFSRAEFLKLTVLDFLLEEDKEWLKKNIFRVITDGGQLSHNKIINLKKNGEKIKVEVYGYNLQFKKRRCRLIVCIDITDKIAVMEKLEEKTGKLIYAERLAKLGYWEVRLQDYNFFWSDEVYRIWGREKEKFQVDVETFQKTIHPEDLEDFRKVFEKAIECNQKLDNEHRIILPNGEVKWVHEKGKVIRDEEGLPLRLEGSVQDITERKNFVDKLMQSEARQRGILKSQTNYLTRINLEGYYTYCNEKFLQDFAWIFPEGQVIGEFAKVTVQEYHREKAEEVFYNCIARPNKIQQVELDKLQEDGTAKSTLWDFICLTDAKGEPLEVQCVGIDITERVKAENALKESNHRYQLVSKATSDAIYDRDIQSGNIQWSEGYYKLFGYPLTSLTPDINSWLANMHPEDNFIGADLFSVVKGNSDSWGAEYRYKKADGQYAFVVEKGTILRNKEGKAVRMVGAIQDITERKMAMQKLMKSEARHRGLIQSQTSYFIRVDMAGEYTYCNNKFQEDFGWIYQDKKIVGKNCMMSIKEYHHQRVADISEKCIKNPDQVFQVEIDKPGKNGTTKTTLWDFIYLKASQDEPGEIQCVGIDITARVLAQKEMKFQANLLDKIGQAVIATDNKGVVNYWNKAATTIYGWLPEEIKGKNIMDQVPSGASTTLALELKEALKKSETWSGELWVKRKDATEFPALITGSPVYDDDHIFKGYIAVSSDNTERKKADIKLRELNKNLRKYTQELVTANKGLEQFSFIVSHNLRSPVANIIGLADLMEEDYPSEIKDQFLKELLDNVKRLDNVIIDLNEILQVKVELTAKREEVDLLQLVHSIESSINRILEKEQAIIITDFSEAPVLSTVQSYLYSIFYNLITNSIKYRKPEIAPEIKIKSKKKDDKVLIIFEDNGLGLDMAKKGAQVFGLYKRFHQHVEGKGMGLFMVKTQVELLGGKILLESEVNKGTIFTLKFNDVNMNIKDERAEALHSS